MRLRRERLVDGHTWLRIADAAWSDPLDPAYAATTGGRWNPPGSFPVLYLNEDLVTARLNMRRFLTGLPYGPEDLRDGAAPVLVGARLPRSQTVADVHTPAGVRAARLPAGYPDDGAGGIVGHDRCQSVGVAAREANLRGVRCRSAQATYGAGRELAWFPATAASRAREVTRLTFANWFWS